MELKTFQSIFEEIQTAGDIEAEELVSEAETVLFINEAIDLIEAEIHKLNVEDDYFLVSTPVSLVAGTSEYALPSDIYASKIRGIVYKDGNNRTYQVKRLRGRNVFERAINSNINVSNTEWYSYLLMNNVSATGDGRKMKFYPTPYETGSLLTMWYVRNAASCPGDQATRTTNVCDIPEFYSIIVAYAKMKIFQKELNPQADIATTEFQMKLQSMKETLASMVEDTDNLVDMDFSFYGEHT